MTAALAADAFLATDHADSLVSSALDMSRTEALLQDCLQADENDAGVSVPTVSNSFGCIDAQRVIDTHESTDMAKLEKTMLS